MAKRTLTRAPPWNASAVYLSAEAEDSAPSDLRLIQPTSDVQRVLAETTLSLARERLHPRRVAIKALRLHKEPEGTVENAQDDGIHQFVRMVRVRLEHQRSIQATKRFHILPRPEDLRNDVFS